MKYDKIVEISKERSRQNTEVALRAIEEMLREGEWITVAELAKRTKLSRANFYVNKDIRKSLDDARYRQQRMLLFGKLNAAVSIRLKRVFQST